MKIWMNKLFKLFKNDKIVTTFFAEISDFEIWAVQKDENPVDLEKPEKMSIWLLS